jgi:hypothetical protein
MKKSLFALRDDILQGRFDTFFVTVEHADQDVEVEATALFDTVSTLAEHEGPDHRLDVETGPLGATSFPAVTDFNAS